MLFAPRMGLSTPDKYKAHMDVLDLSPVVITLYDEHHEACPFEPASLYSRSLRYGNHMVRYLPE